MSSPSNIQPVRGGDLRVPVAGIFDGSFLVAEVRVDEAVAFGVAFAPLEVIEQDPRMIGADFVSVGDGAGKVGEDLAVPVDAADVGNPALGVGAVEVAAA